MTTSHLNRLRNEIKNLEDKSDSTLSKEKCYVINISFPQNDLPEKELCQWSRELILDKKVPPLFVYVRDSEIFAFYDTVLFEGGHQQICSYFSSIYTLKSWKEVRCRLTELETRHAVFAYLLWKNTETQFRCLSDLLNVPFEKVFSVTTLQEATKSSKNKWENTPKFNKYGTVYKLKDKRKKFVLSSFSKPIDSRRRDHYLYYLFGRSEAH